MTVAQIAARLEDRFRLLTGGSTAALPRQQTLRATLDWSFELLNDPERALFPRLSVFAGGWTLEAAGAICVGEQARGPRWELLDLHAGLVEKSLVQLGEDDDGARYRLLETVREYAKEQLAATGDDQTIRERHLMWCIDLAQRAYRDLFGTELETWLGRLEREHDNLRAALDGSREKADTVAELASALWPFWEGHGHLTEGRTWLALALQRDAVLDAKIRARALLGSGCLAHSQGEYEQAWRQLEEALALYRTLGDQRGITVSLLNLGNLSQEQGQYGRARTHLEEALTVSRAIGDQRGIARALVNLGIIAGEQKDYEQARMHLEEALVVSRTLGDRRALAWALLNLSNVAQEESEYRQARTHLEEAVEAFRALGDQRGIAYSLLNLSNIAQEQGDYGKAQEQLNEAMEVLYTLGDQRSIAVCLEALALLAERQKYARRALLLLGAADALRQRIGAPLPPFERARWDQTATSLHDALGESTFAATWAEGQAMSLEQVIALVLADSVSGSVGFTGL